MDSHLVDEAPLGEFADALIKAKYPGKLPENYAELKTKLMEKTNYEITKAIIGSLTEEQGEELSKFVDENTAGPEGYDEFFNKYNLNLDEIVQDAMRKVKNDFEKGGENE